LSKNCDVLAERLDAMAAEHEQLQRAVRGRHPGRLGVRERQERASERACETVLPWCF
jgi:hypothetical protein